MKQPSTKARIVHATSKVRPVPINLMRTAAVHVTQRPFNPAWGKYLAKNMDLEKLGRPVVNFRDGIYWIIDGQHRVFGLRENGFKDDLLDCEVYDGLSDEECASIFLGRNDSKTVASFDKFKVSCTAGDIRTTSVRRAVETQGVKITRDKDQNCFGSVSAALSVYDLAGGGNTGEVVLGQTIRTLKKAFGGDPKAFDSVLVKGAGMTFNRYNGRTDEKHFVSQLASVPRGVGGLLQRAEDLRERTGNQKAHCVAAVLVDIYNKGIARTKDRLPSWWKEAEK